MDTRPLAVKNFRGSLTPPGLEHVDIYRPGRLDPGLIEDTIGAIADPVKAGYVRDVAAAGRTRFVAPGRSTRSAIPDRYWLVSRALR